MLTAFAIVWGFGLACVLADTINRVWLAEPCRKPAAQKHAEMWTLDAQSEDAQQYLLTGPGGRQEVLTLAELDALLEDLVGCGVPNLPVSQPSRLEDVAYFMRRQSL